MALCWICSTVSKFCLYQEAQDWAQHSLCDLSSAEDRQRVTLSTCRQCDAVPDAALERLLALLATRACCRLIVLSDHQSLLCKAASQPVSSWAGVLPVGVQDIISSLFLQVTAIPLNVSISMWFINSSPQFCIICKLAEGELCPVVQVIREDNELCWPQYQPLKYTVSAWALSGLHAPDHNSLSPTV